MLSKRKKLNVKIFKVNYVWHLPQFRNIVIKASQVIKGFVFYTINVKYSNDCVLL